MRVQGTFSDDSLQGTGLEAKLQWQRLKPASGTWLKQTIYIAAVLSF